VDFDLSTNEKKLTDWIWENLEGRFFVGDTFVVDKTTKAKYTHMVKRAAFELHGEASYFAMFLPELNKF